MMISYGCIYKRSNKPVIKGSRVETIEAAREEYKKSLEEGWEKLLYLKQLFYFRLRNYDIISKNFYNYPK